MLVEHLRNVADLTRQFASPFGGGDLGYLAGLWHDAGKADPTWQRYLRRSEAGEPAHSVDHKCAGVLLEERAFGEPGHIGFLIHAHHGGLGNRTGFRDWLKEKRELPGPGKALDAMRLEMPAIADQPEPAFPDFITSERDAELFLRLTYSALVDADSLDTEAHKLAGTPPLRGNDIVLTTLWERYEAFLAKQPTAPESAVNRVRTEVHEACLAAASEQQGVFRLTVPTGGGKTRSALAFALRHGVQHGLRRIVVAVPFTTITQQTAGVYREILGDDRVVLEHHAAATEGVGSGGEDEDGFSEEAVWQRLAAENWDAPVIVTTTVQLFESLFSNRRGKTRKLHNLANSVIILDEVQALPAGFLAPILDGLRQLTDQYGASVVLSTATQPAFELIREFREIDASEIVPEYGRHFEGLGRVRYEWRDKPAEWSEVAGWMREERSALAIVNTKRHAMELLDALQDPDALHLSTLLCGAHRNEVLNEIRERLAAGEPCHVVSTQVVEAGVDLDFPAVFRAEAPLDAIIQAAGRCNREGNLDERGKVVVFAPQDGKTPPGAYETGRDTAREVRALFPGAAPDDLPVLGAYFERMAERIPADEKGIQHARRRLDFPLVAEKFRMIDEDTCDIIVSWPVEASPEIERLVRQLQTRERPGRVVLRQLQPHTVSLYRREYTQLLGRGLIEEVLPNVGRWHGTYDPVRGIVGADPELIA